MSNTAERIRKLIRTWENGFHSNASFYAVLKDLLLADGHDIHSFEGGDVYDYAKATVLNNPSLSPKPPKEATMLVKVQYSETDHRQAIEALVDRIARLDRKVHETCRHAIGYFPVMENPDNAALITIPKGLTAIQLASLLTALVALEQREHEIEAVHLSY